MSVVSVMLMIVVHGFFSGSEIRKRDYGRSVARAAVTSML
jgi:hypothetical protein